MTEPKPAANERTHPGGLPVHSSFDRETHVHNCEITERTNEPLIVSIQTGLNPAVVIMQRTQAGGMNVYDAKWEANTPANIFGRNTVIPLLKERHLRMLQAKFFMLVFPHPGKLDKPSEVSATSQIYSALGNEFSGKILFAPTNLLHPRIAATERFFNPPPVMSLADGRRTLNICPENALLLIAALEKDYHYPVDAAGVQVSDLPARCHPAYEVATAFQYGCLIADQGETFGCSLNDIARYPSAMLPTPG